MAGLDRPIPWLIVLFTFSIAIAQISLLSPEILAAVKEKYGAQAHKRLINWEQLVNENLDQPEMEKLNKVNQFFNRLQFVDDDDHWGVEDYWATPVEMLATRGGDCEDFSIAKYFTLKEMGVPVDKMLITYVQAIELDQAHMVLSYFPEPNREPLILDNLVDKIKLASSRDDLKPIYSFNAEGLWISKERAKGKLIGSPDRLKSWKNLGDRMKAELKMRIPR